MVCFAVQDTKVVPTGNTAPANEFGELGFVPNTGVLVNVSVAPGVVEVALNSLPTTV